MSSVVTSTVAGVRFSWKGQLVDAAWPPRKPASTQARVDFRLPARRPYS